MERKQFEPTEKQLEKWTALTIPTMPADEEFKDQWKKRHGGVERGWGISKRDWVADHANDALTCTKEYFLGLWQGRVDAARGLEKLETPQYHTDPYQFGYYWGYDGFESFWKGSDPAARSAFSEKYIN